MHRVNEGLVNTYNMNELIHYDYMEERMDTKYRMNEGLVNNLRRVST